MVWYKSGKKNNSKTQKCFLLNTPTSATREFDCHEHVLHSLSPQPHKTRQKALISIDFSWEIGTVSFYCLSLCNQEQLIIFGLLPKVCASTCALWRFSRTLAFWNVIPPIPKLLFKTSSGIFFLLKMYLLHLLHIMEYIRDVLCTIPC